jgi:hypothetical protein
MKKELLFIIGLFLISFVISEPSLVMDSSHSIGETVLGVVEITSGNILNEELSLVIKGGRKEVYWTKDMIKGGGNFYFYFYPESLGEYSLSIEGILYNDTLGLNSIDFEKNFSIVEGQKILSVKPGFVFTSGEATIKLTNVGNSTINIDSLGGSFELESLEYEEITFTPAYTFSLYEIRSYKTFKIPVIYPGGSGDLPDSSEDSEEKKNSGFFLIKSLEVEPERINISLNSYNHNYFTLVIKNTGDLAIEDLAIQSEYIYDWNGSNLGVGAEQEVTFDFRQNDSDGKIVVSFAKTDFEIPVFLSTTLQVLDETCSEIGGVLCGDDLTCEGEDDWASDGYCCLGTCVQKKASSGDSYGPMIGILILIILGVAGYFIFQRYKKVPLRK